MGRMTSVSSVGALFLVSVTAWVACDRLNLPETVEHWPLVGKHLTVECYECHDRPVGPEPTDCASCHIGVRPTPHYDGPCEDCHTPIGWDDISGAHEFFPLEGGHAVDCIECHTTEGIYDGLDPACASCHEQDRPEGGHHEPDDCGNCHTIEGWDRVEHDHQCSLPHEGYGECDDCHITESYQEFSCIHCHEHSEDKMNSEHRGETSDYIWESTACLDCHPKCKD